MMRWNYYCDDDEVEKNGGNMDDEREKWANKKKWLAFPPVKSQGEKNKNNKI